jgi:hypothetical protein
MPLNRPNKNATGFMKEYERQKKRGRQEISNPSHPDYNQKHRDINKLRVFGTLDVLAKTNLGRISRVMKPHPTDKGYFKEVYVLYKNRYKYKNLD